jgi:hypothetical protein
MTHPTPDRIMQIGTGFMPARTLQTAVHLGLFTVLGKRGMTAEELRRALDLAPRASPDFFDALVALKLLERDGDGAAGVYRNSADTAMFLDRASPAYMGGILEMAHDRLYPFWGNLRDGLKSGEIQCEAKTTGKSLFEELYADPSRLEQFMAAMSGASTGNFMALAEKFDFSPYKTLCDVGGAEGILSMMVARAHPHMTCISADLAPVEPIAKRKIAAAGLADRVHTAAIDFLTGPLPQADVITMGMILHDWNLQIKQMLIKKAHDALPEGGAFIAIERLIDDARRENVGGLMMSLNMLIETGDGFDYTGADFAGWCKQAGFRRCEVLHLGGPSSAAIAYK